MTVNARPFSDDDPTTRRLMEEILAVEEEHADDLADLPAARCRQHGHKPVQLTVQLDIADHRRAVQLQGTAVIVQRHAGHFRDDAVGDERGQAARHRPEHGVDIERGESRGELIHQGVIRGEVQGLAQKRRLVAHQVHDLLQLAARILPRPQRVQLGHQLRVLGGRNAVPDPHRAGCGDRAEAE